MFPVLTHGSCLGPQPPLLESGHRAFTWVLQLVVDADGNVESMSTEGKYSQGHSDQVQRRDRHWLEVACE